MLVKTKKSNVIRTVGIVSIKLTMNNTIVTITDTKHNTLITGSAGILGLKGSKRSTSYASQSLANLLGKKVFTLGIRYVCVKTKGFGSGSKSAIKGLFLAGLKIIYISNITNLPFNGCRSPKKRRI